MSESMYSKNDFESGSNRNEHQDVVLCVFGSRVLGTIIRECVNQSELLILDAAHSCSTIFASVQVS